MSQKRKSHRQRRSFQLESLEARQLMAADVGLVETYNLGQQTAFLKSDFGDTILEAEPVGTEGSSGGADGQTSPETGNDPRFTINNPRAFEDTGRLVFQVTLDSDVGGPVSVDFQTLDGSAQSQAFVRDYVSNSGTLSFLGFAGEVQEIVVDIEQDALVELDETLQVELSNVQTQGRDVLLPQESQVSKQGEGLIINDDASIIDIMPLAGPGLEDRGPIGFGLTLSKPVDVAVEVPYSVQDVNTTGFGPGADYIRPATDAKLTIPAGSQFASFDIQVLADQTVELDEAFFARLGNATASGRAVSIGNDFALADILNDDVAYVQVASQSAFESDGELPFNLSLSQPVDVPVTIQFSTLPAQRAGDATPKDDFEPLPVTSYVIPAGSLVPSSSPIVKILEDRVIEIDERVIGSVVVGSAFGREVIAPAGSPESFIGNDDEGVLTIQAKKNAVEASGAQLIFELKLTDGKGQAMTAGEQVEGLISTINAGTATASKDFTPLDKARFVIAAGLSATRVTVNVRDDNIVELDEDVKVKIVGIEAQINGSKLNIKAGQNAVAKGTIADTDTATINLRANRVPETSWMLPFDIVPSNPIDAPVTVEFTTLDLTGPESAESNKDYLPQVARQVTIPGNGTGMTGVLLFDDQEVEGDEVIDAEIDNLTIHPQLVGRVSIGTNEARGTIIDDDGVLVSLVGRSAVESADNELDSLFEVRLDRPHSEDITVEVSTVDLVGEGAAEAGNDYTPLQRTTVTVPAGSTSVGVALPVHDDETVELDEAVSARIDSVVSGKASILIEEAIGVIVNDDDARLTLHDAFTVEDSGAISFRLTSDKPIDHDISLLIDATSPIISADTATAGVDYAPIQLEVFLPKNTTESSGLMIPVVADQLIEGTESFTVSVGILDSAGRDVIAGVLGIDFATGTIVDDDYLILDPRFGDFWGTIEGVEGAYFNDRIGNLEQGGGTEAPRKLVSDFEDPSSLPVGVDLLRPNTLVVEDLNDEPSELALDPIVQGELAAIDAVFSLPELLG